jgi:hypothetical protein
VLRRREERERTAAWDRVLIPGHVHDVLEVAVVVVVQLGDGTTDQVVAVGVAQ